MKKRTYKRGGSKKEVLAEKIAELIQQGNTPDEASVIAQYLYKNGGELPSYQIAGFKKDSPKSVFELMKENSTLTNPQQTTQPQSSNTPPEKALWDDAFRRGQSPSQAPFLPSVYDSNTGTYRTSQSANLPSAGNTPPKTNNQAPQTTTANSMDGLDDYMAQLDLDKAKEDLSWIKNTAVSDLGALASDQVGFGQGEFNPQEEEPTQFFNQYAGFDIPTAAYTLGQGIETGNAFDIATSGLKLATGLGRNVLGGVGQARKTAEAQKEFQMKAREASMPKMNYQYQEGGYKAIDDNDVDIISKGTGISFDPEFAKSYFRKAGDIEETTQETEAVRQRQPLDIYGQPIKDITSDGQFTDRKVWMTKKPENFTGKGQAVQGVDYELLPYKSWQDFQGSDAYKNYKAGYPSQALVSMQDGGEMENMNELVYAYALATGQDPEQILAELQQLPPSLRQRKLEAMQNQASVPMMQKGGQLERDLTGEYVSEMASGEKVAELENKEYLQKPDGNISQVEGERHTNGGVELTEEQIPDGSKVVSDHLKLGAQNAKAFKEKYGIEVKASDTYAKAIEKWTQKSGLKKVVEEQEELIKKLKKQSELIAESPQSNTTTNLNVDFIQRKLNELEQQKTPLEEERKVVFDEIFEMQEASKPTENNTTEMQEGGMFNNDMIVEYSKKYGIPEDRVKNLLKEYQEGGLAKYQDAGFKLPVTDIPTDVNNSGMSDAQFFQQQAQQRAVSNVEGKARNYTEQEKEAIKQHYSKFILDKPSLNALVKAIDNNELVFNEGMLQTIGTGEVLPIQLQHKDKSKGTYGGQDEARINGYLYKDTFKQKTGRDFNPNNPEDTKLIYDIVIPALREKGVDYKGAPFRGQKEDAYGNIVASEPGFVQTAEAKKAGSINLDRFRIATPGQKQLIADEYGVPVSELEKQAINPTNKFLRLTPQGELIPTSSPIAEEMPQAEQTQATEEQAQEQEKQALNMMLLPDQSPMMPGSMRPALKAERTYERIDAPRMSPDAIIQEIRRQEQSAMEGISQLPDAQRAAATAQIQANTQAELNKVMSQTEAQNMMAKTQADQFNAQTQRVEEDYRVKDLQDYETKILTADWKTDANLRNYYNQLQKVNMANYNAIENVNLLNQAFENVDYTANGVQATNLAPIPDYKKTKPKKRAGGRFKK